MKKKMNLFQDFAAAILSCCFWAIMLSAVALINGCADSATLPVAEVSNTEPLSNAPRSDGAFPFETQDPVTGETYIGILYTMDHEIGYEKAMGLLEHNEQIIDRASILIDAGFEFALPRTKHIITTVSCDGTPLGLQITTLIFEEPTTDPSEKSYAMIRCLKLHDIKMSVQLEKVFYGDDPWEYWTEDENYTVEFLGLTMAGQPVWAQSFGIDLEIYPQQGIALSPPPDPGSFDFSAWASCVVGNTASGCKNSVARCVFSDGAYFDCVEGGCAQAATGAIVGCTLEFLFYSTEW